MRNPLRLTEIAWAAGFYDGEGYCAYIPSAQSLCLTVVQVDREALERFQEAVGGAGKIYGPYKRQSKKHRSYYRYQAHSKDAEQVISLLYKYLCSPKKWQIDDALEAWVNYRNGVEERKVARRVYA